MILDFGLAKPLASGARRAVGAGAAPDVLGIPTAAISDELLTSPGTLDGIRGDARYRDLLRRMGLPP